MALRASRAYTSLSPKITLVVIMASHGKIERGVVVVVCISFQSLPIEKIEKFLLHRLFSVHQLQVQPTIVDKLSK